MLTIDIILAAVALFAVLQTVLQAWEYFAHDAKWPFVNWVLLLGAVAVLIIVLRSESGWFWITNFLGRKP